MSDRYTRQPARRVFAAEFEDATHTYREDDREKAPKYALLPTGAGANRVFVVGTVTEVRDVGTDSEYYQARVVDPTGRVFVYAGQHQPDAAAQLQSIDPPAYVAVIGKPRTYETDGEVRVSIEPESIQVVEAATRDQWVVETAEQTLARIEEFDPEQSTAAAMVAEVYGTRPESYAEAVRTAVASLDEIDAGDAEGGTPAQAD